MQPYHSGRSGNPSAVHREGREARLAIEESRTTVARLLGVKPAGVVFTSGGTEANNLAIIGYVLTLHATGRAFSTMEIITTAIEHPSVSGAVASLRERGVVVREVAVDSTGAIVPESFASALSENTVLCTFAYANSEIGVVQKVQTLARSVRAFEKVHPGVHIKIHLDAAQAPLWLPCDLPRLDIDILTLDGAKCGGPKGSGAVVLRKGVSLAPVMYGGGQEGGVRPGTENVAGIVGLACALALAQLNYVGRAKKVAAIRDAGILLLTSLVPEAVLNGSTGDERIANNINVSIPGLDSEYAVVVLDSKGVAASTKSACAGAGGGVSTVVAELGVGDARARSTIRFTLGEETTLADLKHVCTLLREHVTQMESLRFAL